MESRATLPAPSYLGRCSFFCGVFCSASNFRPAFSLRFFSLPVARGSWLVTSLACSSRYSKRPELRRLQPSPFRFYYTSLDQGSTFLIIAFRLSGAFAVGLSLALKTRDGRIGQIYLVKGNIHGCLCRRCSMVGLASVSFGAIRLSRDGNWGC